MLDLGFSEMMVIAVVALVVLGPERLPKVARTLGEWVGKMQRYVNDVKADINREVELDELRKFRQTMEDTASSMQSGFNQFDSGARATGDELTALARGDSPGAAAPATLPAPGEPAAGDAPGLIGTPMDRGETELVRPAEDAWTQPDAAGAMRTVARPAIYVAPTGLAMKSPAERATGAVRETAPGSAWLPAREA
jgi:sec-independent protein translocase protein TatB